MAQSMAGTRVRRTLPSALPVGGFSKHNLFIEVSQRLNVTITIMYSERSKDARKLYGKLVAVYVDFILIVFAFHS